LFARNPDSINYLIATKKQIVRPRSVTPVEIRLLKSIKEDSQSYRVVPNIIGSQCRLNNGIIDGQDQKHYIVYNW
jgi:hypothetical protein